MRVKALFREYDYPVNIVSGNQGSTALSGSGTTFTDLKAGTMIEIENYGFAGKIVSVQSDTSLTLDQPLSETFAGRIFWQDWTPFLVALSASSRKTESKQAGKTGVQVYDNISLGFYHVKYVQIEGQSIYNPVAAAFEGDLDNKKRYILRLQAAKRGLKIVPLVTNTYAQLIDNIGDYLTVSVRGDETETFFEGMVDFETLKFPVLKDSEGERIHSVTFDVMDKLSALNNLSSNINQRTSASAYSRIPGNYNAQNCSSAIQNKLTEVEIVNYANNAGVPHTNGPILNPGEILVIWDVKAQKERYHIVLESGTRTATGYSPTWETTWLRLYPNDVSYLGEYGDFTSPKELMYYSALYYGRNDIGIYDLLGRLEALDSVKMIESLLNGFWGDIAQNLGTGGVVPIDYFEQLIDGKPFGRSPLEALQFLIDSNNSYLLIDRNGKAQLHKRRNFSSIPAQNDKVIPELYLGENDKSHVWEKLVDCVEINVRSWIKDEGGKYIDGI